MNHIGHQISYREKTTRAFDISKVEDGNIFIAPESEDTIDITDSYLYCNTCDIRVSGSSVGADDYWEVMAE